MTAPCKQSDTDTDCHLM